MWTELTDTPIGPLRLVATADGRALAAIEFTPYRGALPAADHADDAPVLVAAAEQLTAYFAGGLTAFDLPLAPAGTAFQQRVWTALRAIPFGETASYGQVARALGLTAAASRAVGAANGRNPIPVVVPCHRVVGADGTLTGYAGGLERKQVLLDLERPAAVLF